MPFKALGLSDPLLRAIAEENYHTPTPIQQQAIPAILTGQDILAAAQTGTGKTAGFTLPLLQRLSGSPRHTPTLRALILTPTRELAAQVAECVGRYGKYLDLKHAAIFGGVNINPQLRQLRQGVDLLIATPGRLLDHLGQGSIELSAIEILVLDEADRMLDMGFIHDLRKIVARMPKRRQNLLFSATFSQEVKQLAHGFMNTPKSIEVAVPNTAADRIAQLIYLVDQQRKSELLSHLIQLHAWQQLLVFTRTKHGANRLAQHLQQAGIAAAAIHGNKSQSARMRALGDFKEGRVSVLVATDIAARGLDIDQLPRVVNFELPNVPEDYVHRIGRTGRAGCEGEAISLVCADEQPLLQDIERVLKAVLPRQIVKGFEPTASPASPAALFKTGQGRRAAGAPMRAARGRGSSRSF